jgi:hypothetical protein
MNNRPRIWIPEAPYINLKRYVEVDRLDHGVGIEGWFTVELVHARTGLVKRRLRFRNLITNAGLNALGSGTAISDLIQYLAVGTGSNTPSFTDTALQAEIARTNSNGGFADVDTANGSGDTLVYWSRVQTRVFTESQANGNLAELGFFNQATGGTLWNRQLFLDELGNPTVITKTNEDQLRVQYEYRIYPPMADNVQNIVINGVDTSVTSRPAQVASSASWGSTGALNSLGVLGATFSWVSETATLLGRNGTTQGTLVGSTAYQAYTPGTFYREAKTTFGPSQANFATGVQYHAISLLGSCQYQMVFSPKIQKTNTQRLEIMHRITFNRVTI